MQASYGSINMHVRLFHQEAGFESTELDPPDFL